MQRIGKLGVLFLLIVLLMTQISLMGQSKKNFVISGKVTAEVTSSGGVIEVAKTGGETSKTDIPKNGRFRLELEYFNEFTLTFKVPGNFTKSIIVSTDIPQDVWKRDNDFPPFLMMVQLVKEIEGIDKSFTLKPTGKVFYSKQTDNFEKESLITDAQMAEMVSAAQKQSGQVKKEENIITKQEAQDLAVKQKNYDQVIGEADALFKKGEYLNALLKYQEAKKLFPEKPYASDRIAEIQELVKVLENTGKQKAELEQKYKDAIARANALFEKQSYTEARPGYEEALKYKAGDAYATGQIKEIERLLSLKDKQKQFDGLIVQADENYKSKKLDQALTLYTQAKELIPENEYPQNQINLINKEKQEQARADQQEKDYQALITQADKAFGSKDYVNAQTGYKKAVTLKPADSYPTGRIKEIEQILQNEQQAKQQEESYKATLAKADKSFTSKSYEEAKKQYTDALGIKPGEAYPAGQIQKIDALLADKAKQQQADNDFIALVGKGDAAFEAKDYESARTVYTNALALKPTSADVKAKLKKAEDQLQKIAEDKKKEEERLLAQAKEKEKAYNNAINQANKNINDKKYSEAKEKYQEALSYMPDAEYPKQQISRLDALLAQAGEERKLDESYNAAMKEAETLFTNKDYSASRGSFVKASELKPSEQLPQRRIKDIDKILADLALQQEKDKALEANYQATIKRADEAFTSKEYPSSRSIYGEALTLKANEPYPKNRIAEIDRLLDDAKLQQYSEAITAGDLAFKSDRLDEAKGKYELALTAKADDQYAKKQLSEVAKRRIALQEEQNKLKKLNEQYDAIMADAEKDFNAKGYEKAKGKYQQALTLKPQETLPKERITQIDALLNELRNAEETNRLYAKSMATAETAFRQKKLKESRDAYQAALGYKPSEPVPAQRIAEIDALIAKQAEADQIAAQAVADKQAKEKADKEKYDNAIAQADQAFADKQYQSARTSYATALEVYPAEKYPKDQIARIRVLIAKQEEADRLAAQALANKQAKEKADKEKYDNAIAQADKAFADKQYQSARSSYTGALALLPTEQYPKDQIVKIDELISQEKQANEKAEMENAQANAKPVDSEPVPLTAQDTDANMSSYRTVSNYDDAIKKADEAFGIKDYSIARFFYYKAIELKPGVQYPADQIELIAKLVDSSLSAIDRTGYNIIIKQADDAFGIKSYSVAKFYYYKALEIKPWENYPKDKIHEILVLTNSLLSEKEEQEYNSYIAKADEAFAINNVSVARFYYNKAISVKNNEEYPKSKLNDIQKILDDNKINLKNNQYNKIVELADQAYKVENYTAARYNYLKALNMKPNDQYLKDQLLKISEIMNNVNK